MNGQAPPPPYNPDQGANREGSQPIPASNLPSQPGQPMPQPNQQQQQQQPIAMQPMGQQDMKFSASGSVTPLHLLNEQSQYIDCQFCNKRTRTRVEKTGEGMQFLTGALLCLVCICLAPLPCCLHWFEQTNWFCADCGKQVATRTPESPIHVFPPPHALHVPSQYAGAPGQPPAGAQMPPPHMNPQQQPGSPPKQHPGMPPQQPGSPPQQHPGMPPQHSGSPQPYPGTPGSPPQQYPAGSPQYDITPAPGAPGAPESMPMKN